MKGVGAFLKLFRWHNLLIIAATQYLFRYAIILPALEAGGIYPVLSHLEFLLLVLATMMIGAAGYAINDYFDLRIDRINKPGRIVLGKDLSRRHAIFSHSLLNILAVAIGVFLSWRIGFWPLAVVFLAVPTLLWLYSIRYKRKFLVGNLLVAFLSAFVIGIVWVVEYRSLEGTAGLQPVSAMVGLFARVFAFFAFFTTLVREVIKDVEDVKGDARAGCKTIPVILGVSATRKLLLVMIFLIVVFVGYFQYYLFTTGWQLLVAYLLFLVQIPSLGLLLQGFKATSPPDYRRMQQLLKFVMLAGVLTMLLFPLYF
jgi:4-hydroxybenzoate polyprenyltransferase